MSSAVIPAPLRQALDALALSVDEVLAVGLGQVEPVGKTEVYAEVEERRRQLAYTAAVFLRDMQDSGTAAAVGAPSMTALLQGLIRVSAKEASERVRAAEALCAGRSLTGQLIPARLPMVADLARAGVIGAEHVQVIIKTLHRLPTDLDPDLQASAELTLAENARVFDPKSLSRIGRHLLHRITEGPDAGGGEPAAWAELLR